MLKWQLKRTNPLTNIQRLVYYLVIETRLIIKYIKKNHQNLVIKKMNINLPENKRYYTMGEVATAFGVNQSLIRFWDKEFDILRPRKNAKGNRMFTSEDIKNLQLIYHLVKERGFTLEGAKIHLKEGQKKALEKLAIINKLQSIKEQLLSIKNGL